MESLERSINRENLTDGNDMANTFGGAMKAFLQSLKRYITPWRGPAGGELLSSSSAFAGMNTLPYLDNYTDETDEIRAEYRKMIRDPHVKAAWKAKVDEVAALDWQFHPSKERDPRAIEVADFCDYATSRTSGGRPAIVQAILQTALMEGTSVCEKVWEDDPYLKGQWRGKFGIRCLKAKDLQTVQLSTDAYRNIIAVRGTSFNAGQMFDPKSFVIFSHQKLFDSPIGLSDFRSAYRAYWIKDTVWKLRAIALEKFSTPFLLGEYSQPEHKATLERALEAAKGSTWAAIPQGVRMQLLNLATSSASDYAAAIADLNQEIVVGISGAFLQMLEGSTISGRGDSSIHKKTSSLGTWNLAAAVQCLINSSLVTDLVDINYAGEDYPSVTLGAIDDVDLLPSLQVDQGLYGMGVPLSRKELYKRYSRSAPVDEQDTVRMNPQASGLPFGQAGNGLSTTLFGGGQPALAFAESPSLRETESLLADSIKDGVHMIESLTKRAVMDVAPFAVDPEFLPSDIEEIAAAIETVRTAGELLGRTALYQVLDSEAEPQQFSEGAKLFTFADGGLGGVVKSVVGAPLRALNYFLDKEPRVNVDANAFTDRQKRESFTLAVDTSKIVLTRVKAAIANRLASGQSISTAPEDIEAILEDAGVSSKNPQYSEMVFRTNMLTAYNAGFDEERRSPAGQQAFPVWQYLGIKDGRQGDDHAEHFGKYYSSVVKFDDVRGPRVFNCRCTAMPIARHKWAKLQARGAKIEY